MEPNKITFQESILIPKVVFDKLEENLQKSNFSIDKLEKDILLPVDTKLKNFDYRKKFNKKNSKIINGDKKNISVLNNFVPPSKQPVQPAPSINFLSSPLTIEKREDKLSLDLSLELQMKEILQHVSYLKRNTAQYILEFILLYGKGSIEWNEKFELKLGGERQMNGNIIEAIQVLVGEKEDPYLEYYDMYMRLKAMKIPPSFLHEYETKMQSIQNLNSGNIEPPGRSFYDPYIKPALTKSTNIDPPGPSFYDPYIKPPLTSPSTSFSSAPFPSSVKKDKSTLEEKKKVKEKSKKKTKWESIPSATSSQSPYNLRERNLGGKSSVSRIPVRTPEKWKSWENLG